jgi:hypothetical protein
LFDGIPRNAMETDLFVCPCNQLSQNAASGSSRLWWSRLCCDHWADSQRMVSESSRKTALGCFPVNFASAKIFSWLFLQQMCKWDDLDPVMLMGESGIRIRSVCSCWPNWYSKNRKILMRIDQGLWAPLITGGSILQSQLLHCDWHSARTGPVSNRMILRKVIDRLKFSENTMGIVRPDEASGRDWKWNKLKFWVKLSMLKGFSWGFMHVVSPNSEPVMMTHFLAIILTSGNSGNCS